MNSQHNVRNTFINVLIIGAFSSILYFTLQVEPDILNKIIDKNYDFLPKLIPLVAIHLILVTIISLTVFSKRKTKLADSRLLRPNQLIREQNRMKNSAFAVKSVIPLKARKYEKDRSGIHISQSVKLLTKKTYEHVLLLGPTGTGKSAAFFIPNLLELDDTSIIVTDPKGELHKKTRATLEEKGYTVFHLNLHDPEKSDYYSLLASCANHDDVRRLAQSILSGGDSSGKDENWQRMAENLLLSFMFHEYDRGGKDMTNVIRQMAKLDMPDFELFFSESSDEANFAYQEVKKTAGSDGVISSLYVTIQGRTGVFKYKNIEKISVRNDFGADDFRLRKSALFISYPPSEATTYGPFVNSFFYQMFNKTMNHYSVDENLENRNGLGIIFLMDEFANLGRIPNLDSILTTVRSKSMSIVLAIQSIDQLKNTYGPVTNVIIENCKTKITLPEASGESGKYISQIIGEEEHKQISFSSSKKSDVSMSESTSKKMIFSEDQVRRLKSNELIFVFGNLKPVMDDQKIYYMDDIEYFFYKKLPYSVERNRKIGKWVSDKLKSKQRMKKKELQQKVAEAKTERKIEVQEKRKELNVTRSVTTTEKQKSPEQLIEDARKNPKNQQKVERAKQILNGLDEF